MKPSIILSTLLLGSLPVLALELGAPFANHAVLQRQQPLPVWGWSKPGTEVTVEFAGQKQSAKAADNGKWTVTLAPLEASAEPKEMTIAENGGESRTLKDILVGEVWMASGQSNMQWIASKSSVAILLQTLKDKGEKPPIREFQVTSVYSAPHPIERATGAWAVDEYGDFSAIATAFALKIHEEVKVPIGILNCSSAKPPSRHGRHARPLPREPRITRNRSIRKSSSRTPPPRNTRPPGARSTNRSKTRSRKTRRWSRPASPPRRPSTNCPPIFPTTATPLGCSTAV